MNIEAKQICEKLTPLLAFISGAESQKIELISSPDQAFEDSIVFVGNSQVLDQVLKSNAAAIVVSEKNIEKTKGFKGTVLSSPHVPLAMSLVGRYFFPVTTHKVPFDGENRHPSAVIAKSATVAKSAIIHPNVTIGAETVIGENCIIGANTTIGSNCSIGNETHIFQQVSVSHGTQIGRNVEIHPQTSLGTEGFGYAQDQHFNHYRITHYGKLIIEDNVHIGAGVTVDRGTFEDSRIGKGSIFDNMIHIGHNFRCGERNIFVGGTNVAGSVTIGSRCVFGGRTTIAGHLTICDDVHVAGMSGITKSITNPGKYGGYPILPFRQSLKALASLASLPEMRKTLAELGKKLDTK